MKRILLVDDEPIFREPLRALLESHGYSVVEAADGREALAVLGRENIDLLITDVVMPDLDGIELISRLRREHKNVKAIVLSESDYSQDEVFLKLARVLGAVGAFRKSVDPGELLDLVRIASGA